VIVNGAVIGTGADIVFWEHLILLGVLGVVVGYIAFRIRIAMNPGQSECGGGYGECFSAESTVCNPPQHSIYPA